MSEERKKVKDLASDLGLTTKDILAAAKELNVLSAKVAASSLSDSDISRLRAHFVPAQGPEKQEVIVRRRRKDADPVDAPDKATSEAEQAVGQATFEAETPVVVAASKEVSSQDAKIIRRTAPAIQVEDGSLSPVAQLPVAAPVKDEPMVVEKAVNKSPGSAKASSAKVVQQPVSAKIIKKAGEDKVTPEPAIIPATVGSEPATIISATDNAGKVASIANEAVATALVADTSVESAALPVDVVEEAPKKARVIRPAAFSAEPERNARGEAVSSAPALPLQSDHGGQGEEERSVSQVRVISRPDPSRANAGDQGGYRGRNDGGYRQGRTGASDGRVNDGRANEGRTSAPRSGDSRSGGYRPGGAGQGAGAGRPAGAPRPAGSGAPRPAGAGQGAGAGRPAGAGQGAGAGRGRSSAPQGGMGDFMPSMPSGEGEQGRKKRQKGRRTVEFSDQRDRMNDEDAGWSKTARRGKGRKVRDVAPMGGTQPVKAVKRKIRVDEFIRVSDLAHQMQLKSGEIIKVLFKLGIMATINQSLDIDTATVVAAEFDYEIEKTGFDEQELIISSQEESRTEDMVTRPPVVTIMGHVDHGKTSLLDAIRTTSVVSGEAGGITQHIGAYHVATKKGEIVFLDTPGHEAFTAMRARGAKVTDIVVLVVAADDGVMEQTREAVNHARAAEVPIMVAVNKMDKPSADPDRVKRELSELGLVPEEWGGDTTFSHVSAKTRAGLDELLELLALQAEILELKANPKISARGHIVEAKLDKGRGSLGTVLIQEGTLHLGDSFVCGVHSGRVRAMFDDQGRKVKEAGPSIPVEVQGFEGVPEAGEEFICIADEKAARRIAESRALKQRERELAKESKITLETFLARSADSVEAEVLNLVVKSDVQGSLEAVTDALHKLSTEKVRIQVIHGGTGAISESDVLLATASRAVILGFNVRPTPKAKELAEHEKVDIRFYDIIYKLVEEIRSAMEGLLAPVSREEFLGTADVREIFSVPKVGVIAGCHVSDGKIIRNAHARLLRDGVVVHTGKIGSLRRFKDDVREVAKGYECGIGLDNYNDIKVGDVIEVFEIVEEAAKL